MPAESELVVEPQHRLTMDRSGAEEVTNSVEYCEGSNCEGDPQTTHFSC